MKRALVIINTLQEAALQLYKQCVTDHQDFTPKYLTFSSAIAAGLSKHGIDCICLEAEQTRVEEQSIKRSCEIMLDSPFEKSTFPGTTLPVWSVLFWDRLLQFVNTTKRDNQWKTLATIDFQLLITPFDGFDTGARLANVECIRNGIPRIGVQTSFLRTKEMLDTPVDFEKIYVFSDADASFLARNKHVPNDAIRISNQTPNRLLHLEAQKTFWSQREGILARFGLEATGTNLLLVFSIRHIWELRQALKNIAAHHGTEIDRGHLKLAVYAESPVEANRFPTLFKAEAEALSLKLIPPTQDLLMLMCSVNRLIAFRVGQLTDLAELCGVPTTIYDPSLFNRSNLLLPPNSSVHIHNNAECMTL